MKDEEDLRYYEPPPHIDQNEWQAAQQASPDDSLVPTVLIGFDGLMKRREQQDTEIGEFDKLVNVLLTGIKKTEEHRARDQRTLERIRDRHRSLSHRMLRVMEKVDRTLARDDNLHPHERQARNQLENMERALNRPTEFKARLNELVALERMQDEPQVRSGSLHPDALKRILDHLEAQKSGLEAMVEILRKDKRDLHIMDMPSRPPPAAFGGFK